MNFFIENQMQFTCPTWGPYIDAHGLEGEGELLFSEVMADISCIKEFTYWSTINFSLGPRGGYCGIQRSFRDGLGWVYNNIFSIWDLNESKTPECYTEYQIADLVVNPFGNEGTGIHTSHNMPWTPGIWYATAVRRWYIGNDKTHIGFFMYDYGTKLWTHYSTIVTPEPDARFEGEWVGSFLERFGGDNTERCGYYRNTWKLMSTGNWIKPSFYKASAGDGAWRAEKVVLNIDSTAIKLYSCGNYIPPQMSYDFISHSSQIEMNINDSIGKPIIALPANILHFKAYYDYSNNTVLAEWQIDHSKSPQLSYTISVFNVDNKNENPIIEVTKVIPHNREEVFTTSYLPVGKYFVMLIIKDIFNNYSEPFRTTFDVPNINT